MRRKVKGFFFLMNLFWWTSSCVWSETVSPKIPTPAEKCMEETCKDYCAPDRPLQECGSCIIGCGSIKSIPHSSKKSQ